MKKRLIAMLLTLTLCLSGLLSVASAEAMWDTSKQDEIILSVINNYYTAGWKKAAEDYMALHPETKVIVDVVADNDTYFAKMTTWLTGDTWADSADIVHVNFAADPVGGYQVMYQKGMVYDFRKMLDEPNPYNGGKAVRDCLDENAIALADTVDGLPYIPFDWVGIALIYNKTLLDEKGLPVPTSYEQFKEVCQTLRDGGMAEPIAASSEADWYLTSFADAAYRNIEHELLVQPGDALWDEALMEANKGFTFDESDMSCDRYTRFSAERLAMWQVGNRFLDDKAVAVWDQYQGIARYFTQNYAASASTETIASFEMGNSAFIISGSWNVGVFNADITAMGDRGFEWGSMAFPSYENPPEGFQKEMRSLYGLGNAMGIILPQGEGDHLERVKDFYKFVYSPDGCKDLFETTLNAGNFVQGPPAVAGFSLSDELNAKLEGFVQEGAVKADLNGLVRQDPRAEDKGTYIEATNKFMAGEIDVKAFLEIASPIWMRTVEDRNEKNGYDLDPTTPDTPKQ